MCLQADVLSSGPQDVAVGRLPSACFFFPLHDRLNILPPLTANVNNSA